MSCFISQILYHNPLASWGSAAKYYRTLGIVFPPSSVSRNNTCLSAARKNPLWTLCRAVVLHVIESSVANSIRVAWQQTSGINTLHSAIILLCCNRLKACAGSISVAATMHSSCMLLHPNCKWDSNEMYL